MLAFRPRAFPLCIALCAAVTSGVQSAIAEEAIDVPFAQAPADLAQSVLSTPSFNGARLLLQNDFTFRRKASVATDVYVLQDSTDLIITFDVHQVEPITSTQVTNSSSVLNDDYVGVELNPTGSQGFSYAFYANSSGARYQTSSENSAYSPQWVALSRRTPSGYVVSMQVPLRLIRAQGSRDWKAQFLRHISSSTELSVWAYSPKASIVSDPSYFGVLKGIGVKTATTVRAAPRIQPYFLGESAAKSIGGNVNRVGLDAAIPLSSSSSFIASVHPDYSNVEVDQQTIAPTAFARQFSDVRPFFTQAGSFFGDAFGCDYCPASLYTPAIPKFEGGFAVEGTAGNLNFAAFDAIGTGRNDNAQTINYHANTTGSQTQIDFQRVNVKTASLTDTATSLNLGYLNKSSHLGGYVNLGIERGTIVTTPKDALYLEGGPEYQDSTTLLGLSYQKIGAQYAPVDGFVSQPDLDGYIAFAKHSFNFSPKSSVHDVFALASYVREWNKAGTLANVVNAEQLRVSFKNLISVQYASNGVGTVGSGGPLLPYNSSGITLGYRTSTNTPSYISFLQGPYYHGKLSTRNYVTNLPIARRFTLALEADKNSYFSTIKSESSTSQWLERGGLDWQVNQNAEIAFGSRRIIGRNLPNSFQPLDQSSPSRCSSNVFFPGCLVDAGNLSFAFHFLTARNEFYVGYGDPNSLSTYPSAYIKWIRYIGAEKGS